MEIRKTPYKVRIVQQTCNKTEAIAFILARFRSMDYSLFFDKITFSWNRLRHVLSFFFPPYNLQFTVVSTIVVSTCKLWNPSFRGPEKTSIYKSFVPTWRTSYVFYSIRPRFYGKTPLGLYSTCPDRPSWCKPETGNALYRYSANAKSTSSTVEQNNICIRRFVIEIQSTKNYNRPTRAG